MKNKSKTIDSTVVADANAVCFLSRPLSYPVDPGGQQRLSRTDIVDLYWKALKLMAAADAPTVDLEFRQMARLYAATFQRILRHTEIDHRDIEFGLAYEAYGNDDWHLLKALVRFQQYLVDRGHKLLLRQQNGKPELGQGLNHSLEKAKRAEKKFNAEAAKAHNSHVPAMVTDPVTVSTATKATTGNPGGAE